MIVLATPLVKWSAVGKILLAGLIGGAGVVVVFGFLLLGLSRARSGRGEGRLIDYTISAVCGLLVLAAVVAGIYAMVNKPASPKPKKAAAALVSGQRQRRLVA